MPTYLENHGEAVRVINLQYEEIDRLKTALEWIADHSNDPGVVKRARQELDGES